VGAGRWVLFTHYRRLGMISLNRAGLIVFGAWEVSVHSSSLVVRISLNNRNSIVCA
jgi:hypothetical protein